MKLDMNLALSLFNDGEVRVIPFDNNKKWFIIGFIEFQYVSLREGVSLHKRVIDKLSDYGIYQKHFKDGVFDFSTVGGTVQGTVGEGYKTKKKKKDKDKEKEKDWKKENKYMPLLDRIVGYFPQKVVPVTDLQFENWLDCLRLCEEVDGYSWDSIELIVKWAREDDFWSTNFLSLLKLRKKDKNGILFINRFEIEITKHYEKKGKRNGSQYDSLKREIANRNFNN